MFLFNKTFLYVLVVYFTNFEQVSGKEDSPSVIIIGAGAAGIAAASRLFKNGFKKVTILEAENRIGGRINTTTFNKYLVDLGAQYIYPEVAGSKIDNIDVHHDLMDKDYNYYKEYITYDSSGTRIYDVIARNELDKNIVVQICSGKEKSVGQCLDKALRTNLKLFPESKDKERLIKMFLMSESANFGADIGQVSTKNYEQIGETYREALNWKDRGYSIIFDVMMQKYPNPAKELPVIKNTMLNTEVSLIQYNLKDEKVIIKTTNGKTYCADHVIVTIPLGVLKEKYNTLFKPPLPEKKVKTIKGLGYGNQEKIFVFFDKPFWNSTKFADTNLGFSIYWKDEDRAALAKDSKKSWLLGLHEFRFVKHRPKLLMSRVSEKYSQDMNKLSDQQVLDHIVEVFQKFFGKDYDIVEPIEIIRSKWNTNKHFEGSWTYYKIKKPNDDEVFCKDLAIPIGNRKPTILFAGEATDSHMFGTVQGAIYSGNREARRLTSIYPNLKLINKVEASKTSQKIDS